MAEAQEVQRLLEEKGLLPQSKELATFIRRISSRAELRNKSNEEITL